LPLGCTFTEKLPFLSSLFDALFHLERKSRLFLDPWGETFARVASSPFSYFRLFSLGGHVIHALSGNIAVDARADGRRIPRGECLLPACPRWTRSRARARPFRGDLGRKVDKREGEKRPFFPSRWFLANSFPSPGKNFLAVKVGRARAVGHLLPAALPPVQSMSSNCH